MARVALSLSGGMDSAVLLADLANKVGVEVHCFTFFYGSKNGDYEVQAAINLTRYYGVPLRVISLSSIMAEFNSALLRKDQAIPEGHPEAEEMRLNIVPSRNTIFSSILAGIAESQGLDEVCLGIHSGQDSLYPDSREGWFNSMRDTIRYSSEDKVDLCAPFLYENKITITKLGLLNETPFLLTRTCYANQAVPCGRCGACQKRLRAFEVNQAKDPLEYESRDLLDLYNKG